MLNSQLGDGLAYVEIGDVFVGLWRDDATPARWEWHMKAIEALVERNPQGTVVVSLILASSGPPDARVRATARTDFDRLGDRLRRFIAVPIGDSLWMTVVRTIVRGTLLLSGAWRRQDVADSIEEAITLVGKYASPKTPSADELRQAVDLLHHTLGVSRSDRRSA